MPGPSPPVIYMSKYTPWASHSRTACSQVGPCRAGGLNSVKTPFIRCCRSELIMKLIKNQRNDNMHMNSLVPPFSSCVKLAILTNEL